MHTLGPELRTRAAPNNRMTENEFARSNEALISERAFWLVVALALIFFAAHSAQATTTTWGAKGAPDNWNSSSNWTGNNQAGPGDDALFDNSGQSPLEDIFLNAPQSINGLTINLTVGSNQNWNLGANNNTSAETLTLATGNISVPSTSGTTVRGEVIAKKVLLSGAGQISRPSVVSQ